MGFVINKFDWCVVNKVIDGHQYTVAWYFNDDKVSHVELKINNAIVAEIEKHFRNLTVTREKPHEYWGMNITLRDDKKIEIQMKKALEDAIECFREQVSGIVPLSAAWHLFTVNEEAEEPHKEKKDIFHSLIAKLLYL